MDAFFLVVLLLISMLIWSSLFMVIPRLTILMMFCSAVFLLLHWNELDNHKMDFLKGNAVVTTAEITGHEMCMSGAKISIPNGMYKTNIMYRDKQGWKYNKTIPCGRYGYYSLSGVDLIYDKDDPDKSLLRCAECTEDISFVTVFPYDWLGYFYFIFGFLAFFKYVFSWVDEENRKASGKAQ